VSSRYAWSVLGAAAQATHRIPLMTYVTCPIRRGVLSRRAGTSGRAGAAHTLVAGDDIGADVPAASATAGLRCWANPASTCPGLAAMPAAPLRRTCRACLSSCHGRHACWPATAPARQVNLLTCRIASVVQAHVHAQLDISYRGMMATNVIELGGDPGLSTAADCPCDGGGIACPICPDSKSDLA
jgi:hypothetical protein